MSQTTGIGKYRWVICALRVSPKTIDCFDRHLPGRLIRLLDRRIGLGRLADSDTVIPLR